MNKNRCMSLWLGIAALVISTQVVGQSATCVNACLASDCNATDYPKLAARNNCLANSKPGCQASCVQTVVPTTAVPNLVGRLLSAASAALASANLSLGQVTGLNDSNLYVVAQSPAAGSSAPLQSPVAVTIETPPPLRTSTLEVGGPLGMPYRIEAMDYPFRISEQTMIPLHEVGQFSGLVGNMVRIPLQSGHDYVFRAFCKTVVDYGCCPYYVDKIGICTVMSPSQCIIHPYYGAICWMRPGVSRVWRGDSTVGGIGVSIDNW